MLSAQKLGVRRGGRQILTDIDLELKAGEVLGVLGANGAGKSTLLSALTGELPSSAGLVSFEGYSIARYPLQQLARRRVVLPQSPSLSFDLPVATIIGMGAYPHTGGGAKTYQLPARRGGGTTAFGQAIDEVSQEAVHSASTAYVATGAVPAPMGKRPASTVNERIPVAMGQAGDRCIFDRAVALADVGHLIGRRYRRLSGGEQQRVHFARVLYQLLLDRCDGEYRALLLDEPIASLDPRHQLMLLQAVRSLAHDEGIAALVILHDVNLAAAWCDRLLLLADGRVAALGSPQTVLTPAILQQVYDVQASVTDMPGHPGQPLVVFGLPARGA
ncbi:MAG: heme ABC transporter ATP-binding protein [Lautropia sp.]|nr:heme ABC transporter ATP-binding protein [Lautropia sp.]